MSNALPNRGPACRRRTLAAICSTAPSRCSVSSSCTSPSIHSSTITGSSPTVYAHVRADARLGGRQRVQVLGPPVDREQGRVLAGDAHAELLVTVTVSR